jgi:hypothetical protein
MRAIHSHRAHSATSQGVYLSGRRTPGGTSRARRLLATNTALLTSAHRMISPPSHKRKPCTLPTHPPCTTPQNQKLRRHSKRARTPLARSLSPQTHRTPNPRSLSSPPPRPLADFLSRPAPDATRRGALRPFPRPHASLAAANRSTTTATDEEATSQGRLTIQPPRATLSTTTPANAAAALDTNMPHAAPHARTHAPASSPSPIGRRRRSRGGRRRRHSVHPPPHTQNTHAPPLSPGHRAQETQGGPPPPPTTTPVGLLTSEREEAATSRAAEPRRSHEPSSRA